MSPTATGLANPVRKIWVAPILPHLIVTKKRKVPTMRRKSQRKEMKRNTSCALKAETQTNTTTYIGTGMRIARMMMDPSWQRGIGIARIT
jgi:hypothetical protein